MLRRFRGTGFGLGGGVVALVLSRLVVEVCWVEVCWVEVGGRGR